MPLQHVPIARSPRTDSGELFGDRYRELEKDMTQGRELLRAG